MRVVAVDRFDTSPERNLFTENAQKRSLLNNTPSKRVLGHESDDENGIARVTRTVLEMVQDSTRLRHA